MHLKQSDMKEQKRRAGEWRLRHALRGHHIEGGFHVHDSAPNIPIYLTLRIGRYRASWRK